MSSRSQPSLPVPRFSVVVVAYNSRENLPACSEAFRRAFNDALDCAELIVVDNASRDGTTDLLRGLEGVRAVYNLENLGFARACNQGARLARGEFLIFLNPDALLTRHACESMAAAFADSQVGAAGPVSNYVAGRQRLDHHWPASAGELAAVGGATALDRAEAVAAVLRREHAGALIETKLLIGFCLMLRREEYAALGGMDENLFLGNDDLELSWRLRRKGLRLVVARDAFVFHEGQKSFRTEPRGDTDRLVQESTDALFRKLSRHYGGDDKVPGPEMLWDMQWFRPSPAAHAHFSTPTQEAAMATDATTRPPHWTHVVVLPPAGDTEGLMRETLDSLPMRGQADVIVLNRSAQTGFLPPGGDQVRKLDVGPDLPLGQGLRLAAHMARHTHLLLLDAGLCSSTLLNQWLEKQDDFSGAFSLDVCAAENGSRLVADSLLALACRRSWLEDHLTEPELVRVARLRLTTSAAPAGAPALTLRAELQTASTAEIPFDPNAGGLFLHYPETLRDHLQEAENVGFAGSAVAPVPVAGPGEGVDLRGEKIALARQDLLVLRVSPDLVDALPQRLRNLRGQLNRLRCLVAILNANQALGRPRHPRGFETPVDVTSEGVTAALRLAGYDVTAVRPYHGFPGRADGGPRVGWWQLDARPRAQSHRLDARVSIILLGFNQVEYTRQCVESIRRNVRQSYELILIDNGSRDGTWEYFQSVPGARCIRNEDNRGVAAGWNQGLRAAQGDYVLILNNDTVLFPGTLEHLVRLCETDPSIGIVGPRCNRIAGAQAVEGVPYRSRPEMETFAAEWQRERDLASADYDWLKGVCLLIPRAACEKIGPFDERFGKGNFEDDDYCLRARYLGYRTCIAHDSYIHHYGSVSFGQEDADWTALMQENERKFTAKWQHGATAVGDVQLRFAASAEVEGWIAEGHAAYARGDLDAARRSFLRAADADPGQAEVLSALGALCFHQGEYRDSALLSIRSLIRRPEDKDTGMNVLDALRALNGEVSESEKAALRQRFPANSAFAVTPQTSWTPVAAAPGDWRSAVEELIRGGRFDEALNRIETQLQSGRDAGACHNFMGVIAAGFNRFEEALDYFRQAAAQDPGEANFSLNLAETLIRLRRPSEAQSVLETAAGARPHSEYPAAAEQLRRTLTQPAPDWDALFLSWDVNSRAEAALRAGKSAEAETQCAPQAEAHPGDFRAWNNRGVAAFQLGRADEAWRCFERSLDLWPDWDDALANAFDAALATRNKEALARRLEAALRAQPDHVLARRMQRHLEGEGEALYAARAFDELEAGAALLEKAESDMKAGRPAEALRSFLDAVEKRPENPQALNGLGIIAFAQNRFDDSFRLFEQAARLNPQDQDILLNLWESARAVRRESDVRPALEQSLHRHPEFHEVRQILSGAV